MDEVKKLLCYRRLIKKTLLQVLQQGHPNREHLASFVHICFVDDSEIKALFVMYSVICIAFCKC